MNITINLNLSEILSKSELRNFVLNILPILQDNGVAPSPEVTTPTPDVEWEYAPKLGKRRNKTEQALHEKEIELGRLLTPEEKGEIDAYAEIDEEKEAKAKEDTKKKVRIDEIAEEANEAAAKELAEEAKQSIEGPDTPDDPEPPVDAVTSSDGINDLEDDGIEDTVMPGEAEATIPKTEEVSTQSLFS